MNGYQRALLFASGGLIAFLQYLATTDEGFSENRGWATGFLIAVVLIFVGMTSDDVYRRILARLAPHYGTATNMTVSESASPPPLEPATKTESGSTSFDVALNEQVLFAAQQDLWRPRHAKGKNLRWCAVVAFYCNAKMANADGSLESNQIIWNSLIHRLTIEMLADSGVRVGDAGYAEAESDAYSALQFVEVLVRDSASWERLAGFCADLYGWAYDPEKVSALTNFLTTRASHTKIVVLPSFLSAFE